MGGPEHVYYRLRREYGGLKVSQALRLKDLEKENQRLRKSGSDRTLSMALTASGCDHATGLNRLRLLSENGASYIDGELADYRYAR